MVKQANTRNPALDVIRCLALFCVVGVHFFMNAGFYEVPTVGSVMYWMCLLRTGFMICVPLFLMLSGYLMKNRKPEKAYYQKIGKTLAIYLLASLCCGAYYAFAATRYWGESYSLLSLFLGIFSFSTAPYGWYIGMYIGLFLLIPYLNILYSGLTREHRKRLILILLFMTALPGVLNVHNLSQPGWWLTPSSSAATHSLVPDWWVTMYPITYYFLGAYLRDYPLKLNRWLHLLLIAVVYIALGSYSYYRSTPGKFIIGFWAENGSLLTTVQSVLVFSFLAQLDLRRMPRLPAKLLAWLSECTMGAYLVSWIFDQHFYSSLRDLVPEVTDRLRYFLPVVGAVYGCSLALSMVLNLAWLIPEKLLSAAKKQKTP